MDRYRNYTYRQTARAESSQRTAYPNTEGYNRVPGSYNQNFRYGPESNLGRSNSEDRSRRWQENGNRRYERSISSGRYPNTSRQSSQGNY